MPTTDSKDIAQLVLECRQLRAQISAALEHREPRSESPFLRAQVNTEVEGLREALTLLSSVTNNGAKVQKPGFLKSLFQLEEYKEKEASFGLEGTSASIPLTEMIGFLSNSGRSGVLWVYARDEAFMIEFAQGEMTRALSDKTPKGLRLGEILVDQGVINEKEIKALVSAAHEAGAYFGTYLMESGQVAEAQLRNAFAVQVQSLFHRMNSAKDAIYRFQEDVDLSDAQDLNLSVTGLLLECARMEDEAQRSAQK